MTFELLRGDCRDVMATLDAESIDAVVCDPPYSLGFMGRAWDSHAVAEDAAFGYWLAGFTDGEGHFRVQAQRRGTYSCAFSIHLRRDDRAILERIQRFLGCGSVTDDTEYEGRNPMSKINIQAKADCLRVVDVFTRYPLRAKKLRDFLRWADAVVEWNGLKKGNRWAGHSDWSRLDALKYAVERAREYRDPPWSGNAFQDWSREWAEAAYRVLKPGAHLVAFGAPRTYHRLASAIEDAGFEIRDSLMWLFGSGFPKSLDVSKAIDKAAGADREIVGKSANVRPNSDRGNGLAHGDYGGEWDATAPATDLARQWEGWGTALKPAYEPIVLARKPLAGTVAANVQQYGTGALNIDATRIEASDKTKFPVGYGRGFGETYAGDDYSRTQARTADANPGARWPANVLLDADAARQLDAMSGATGAFAPVKGDEPSTAFSEQIYGDMSRRGGVFYGDTGGASRFFFVSNDPASAMRFAYSAKASRSEREFGLDDLDPQRHTDSDSRRDGAPGSDNPRLRVSERRNDHPTVKPIDVMRWLCRLITPPGGTILDPFCGSGSTGMAALDEGFQFIGIDLDERYIEIARRRIARRHLIEPLPQRDSGQGVLL